MGSGQLNTIITHEVKEPILSFYILLNTVILYAYAVQHTSMLSIINCNKAPRSTAANDVRLMMPKLKVASAIVMHSYCAHKTNKKIAFFHLHSLHLRYAFVLSEN